VSADAPRDHVTPYDRFAWSDTQIERWLARGEHAEELGAYFGVLEHRELRALARRAARAAGIRAAPTVLIVPGIMGSQLGLARAPPLPNDIVWIDPIDIQLGRLAALRLPGPAPVVPLGVVLFSYLRLKLQLRARGFAVQMHDYDWRLPVTELGRDFARRLRELAPTSLAIVAHSMGGLVARAALAQPDVPQVEQVVLLGTPNEGSFAVVQALRGTYAVVRKVARLDGASSAEALTREVFSSFPSLYDMLPRDAGLDLFDPAQWPTAGPQPRAALLAAARATQATLAPADARFTVVAGTGQETVTAVRRRGNQFVYTLTRHGDGTVPTVSALLPGARSLYARVAHSDLTRDAAVAAAVAELLRRGRTARLSPRLAGASRACAQVSDTQLRRSHVEKVDWTALTPQARRVFLENLNEPPRLRLRVPAARRR
jgi:pimeloyl-ACP methyl ester carboxylesterase